MSCAKNKIAAMWLAFTFCLKSCLKAIKLMIRQECALTKLGNLLSFQNIIHKYYKGTPRGTFDKFWPSGASGCQLANVGPINLTKMIKFDILSMGMGFDYSNTPS